MLIKGPVIDGFVAKGAVDLAVWTFATPVLLGGRFSKGEEGGGRREGKKGRRGENRKGRGKRE